MSTKPDLEGSRKAQNAFLSDDATLTIRREVPRVEDAPDTAEIGWPNEGGLTVRPATPVAWMVRESARCPE